MKLTDSERTHGRPGSGMPPEDESPLDAVQQQRLALHFAALRQETAMLTMPAHHEDALLAAFRKHHAVQRVRPGRLGFFSQWFAPGLALAASIGMAAWMAFAPLARVELPQGAPYTLRGESDAPFVALQSLEQIAAEPAPRVVTAAVPRMWLASYGVPVNPEIAGDSVRAQMLVSANGQPLAMRFVP